MRGLLALSLAILSSIFPRLHNPPSSPAPPVGPFGGKNFGTSISPWVVTVEALKPFGIAGPTQDPAPLPYLADPTPTVYNIDLQVSLTPKGGSEATVLTRSNAKYLYWTFAQMLAHHSVTGCNMQPGDLLGSGTISGPEVRASDPLSVSLWLVRESSCGGVVCLLVLPR